MKKTPIEYVPLQIHIAIMITIKFLDEMYLKFTDIHSRLTRSCLFTAISVNNRQLQKMEQLCKQKIDKTHKIETHQVIVPSVN